MKAKAVRKSSATRLKATSKVAKKSAAKEGLPRPKRKTEEQTLQMIAVQWFRKAYPNVLAFHVPNGELRNRKVAEKLQRMGVLAGVLDWFMFPGFERIALDFKSKKGVLSNEQKRFMIAWIAAGGKCVSVNSIEQFIEVCTHFCGPSFIDLANKHPNPAKLGVNIGV